MTRALAYLVTAAALLGSALAVVGDETKTEMLPRPGSVVIDKTQGQLILSAVVKHPRGKPCIDEYGQRVQAFVGCGKAAGGDAKMAGYFVFLVDAPLEDVYKGMVELGAKSRVHYSIQEGKKHSGLRPDTRPEDYLQGDPVVLSVFWKEGSRWVEHPYEYFTSERVLVEGKPIEKPWTPHFVFHGSGAIYKAGTGCVACPCDCAGGLIADNRYPLYDPKPLVKFDMSKAPRPGTQVYVRIRTVVTK